MHPNQVLPLVLCGPMLRRVEKGHCYLWIATSRKTSKKLLVYRSGTSEVVGRSLEGEDRQLKLGANLYIDLLDAIPLGADGYSYDEFLEYSLEIDGQPFGDLKVSELLLPGFTRPSFFIPRNVNNILVGSCRKPHSSSSVKGAKEDALAYACTLLEKDSVKLNERPAMLLLLGDQIYADDVAAPLLQSLKTTSLTLIGADENIPNIGQADSIPYEARWEITYRIGFTTGNGANHLLTFGEYCAMYIAVYGGFYSPLKSYPVDMLKGISEKENDRERQRYAALTKDVLRFLDGCRQVRRLMANIPSYAIFDDHEVTDDWYLDRAARQNIEEDSAARRIVTNALCAYWAFQGWGNDPLKYDQSFLQVIQPGVLPEARTAIFGIELERRLIEFNAWHFVTPSVPPIFF